MKHTLHTQWARFRKILWISVCLILALFQPTFAEIQKEFAFFEQAYPHRGVYCLTDAETGEVSYVTDDALRADWMSHFMPYYWETKLPYRIFEKRFSNLPGLGWVEQNPYPEGGVLEEKVFRVSGEYEPVEKEYRLFGCMNFRIVGKNRVSPADSLYERYASYRKMPDLAFLSAENLSQKDEAGNYLISDGEIAKEFPLFSSPYLYGRDYANNGVLEIDVAKEILSGKNPDSYDSNVLMPSMEEAEISWVLFSEPNPPYQQGEYLCVNGVMMDGRVENGVKLPRIFRYNGEFGQVFQPIHKVPTAKIYAFTYHWISSDPLNWGDYTIPKEEFEKDIRYLYENDFYFATASELFLAKGNYPAENIALITFDDGYASCYTDALPVLEQYGAKATMFLVGSYLDQPDYLSKEQVKLLAESPLVELGNHSYQLHNHPKYQVKAMYANQLSTALSDYYQNEQLLKELTGKTITAVSYPYGEYTYALEKALKQHGYEVSLSTRAGNNHNTAATSALNRLNRSLYTSAQQLIAEFGS